MARLMGNNDGSKACARLFVSQGSCRYSAKKWRHQRPGGRRVSSLACRRLGPTALRAIFYGFAQKPTRVRLGPRGYYRRPGNGGTQTCLPAAQGVAHFDSQVRPSAGSLKTRPSREPRTREGSSAKTRGGIGLPRPPPERRRSLCNARPREVKDDASRARRAPARAEETVSPLVQRR